MTSNHFCSQLSMLRTGRSIPSIIAKNRGCATVAKIYLGRNFDGRGDSPAGVYVSSQNETDSSLSRCLHPDASKDRSRRVGILHAPVKRLIRYVPIVQEFGTAKKRSLLPACGREERSEVKDWSRCDRRDLRYENITPAILLVPTNDHLHLRKAW